jgi:hypothetical protein
MTGMIMDLPKRERDFPPIFRRDSPPGNSFVRIIAAQVIGHLRRMAPREVAETLWPSDRYVFDVLTRAASAPAMTTVAGWAMELAHKVVKDQVEALAPASAAARVIAQGLVLTWDGAGVLSVPAFVAGAGNASFVAEGAAIPVRQFPSTAVALNPHKLAAIALLTRELVEGSNAEAAIADVLVRSEGAALDVAFFAATAETAAQPAGMKYNIATSTPSAATDLWQAAFEDVATLINAVSPVGGSGPYIIIGSPGRAVAMALRFNIDPGVARDVAFYGSNALGNDLCAIAPNALATAISPNPEVESVTQGTLVMDDTAPGAPGTTGSAEKSVFQTDSLAIKVRWPVAWALRDPRGFAWMTPNWKPG